MLKIENVVLPSGDQLEAIIRGMRNPKNSWDLSDSKFRASIQTRQAGFEIGPADQKLMTTLRKAGAAHAKYSRMIWVYCDITAPIYWWKEWDTYEFTVRNSCSTMHKLDANPIKFDDFSIDSIEVPGDLAEKITGTVISYIDLLETLRQLFKTTGDKKYWRLLIQLLPESYNQRATIMMNYETLNAMYKWRRTHKLSEWHTFCDWLETLPMAHLITGGTPDVKEQDTN